MTTEPDRRRRGSTPTTSGRTPFPSAELLDMIRADATAADARADLGEATFARMLDEGLFHILVPPELGGAGGTPRQWFDATLTVAHADASAGWILAQGAVQNAWLAVAADERFARTTSPPDRRSPPAAPAGWSPSSSTMRTSCTRPAGLRVGLHPRRLRRRHGRHHRARRTSETRVVLQPVEAATIRPTWDTLGLRATASNDVDFGERAESRPGGPTPGPVSPSPGPACSPTPPRLRR